MTSKRAHTLCFGLLLMLGLSCSAHAQKIGFVNIPYILQQHPKVQQVNETLRSEFAPIEAELKATEEALKEKEERYNRDSAAMGASERDALRRELEDGARSLQRRIEAVNEDFQIRQNELGQQLQRDIALQIQRYVEDEGYDLVVADAVYVSDDLDITTEVFEAITDD